MKKFISAILLSLVAGIASIILSVQEVNAASVAAGIDWGNQIGKTATRLHYGLNAYQYTDPNIAGTPGNSNYKANVAFMEPGIIRLHNLEQMNDSTSSRLGWVISPDTASYSWNVTKITNALNNAYEYNTVKMMNIANWPSYMDDGTGKLQPSMYDAYASFCAELVRIINVQLGKNVTYWEVTNEKDNAYGDDMESLAQIFNKANDAMKAVDSSIKVGGPAFANAYNFSRINAFITATKDRIDFISYHTYSPSDSTTTKAQIWNSASEIGYPDSVVSSAIKNIVPNRASVISTFPDEFNMERTSRTEQWLTDTTSLIYDALAIRSIIKAGATGAMAWNEGDNWWGKLNNDPNWTKRPASYLYKILNEHLLGSVVSSSSSNKSLLQILATKSNESPQRAFMLVNRSQADKTVQMTYLNWDIPPSDDTPVSVYQAGMNGYSTEVTTHSILTSNQGYLIPANTVTVFEYYPPTNGG
jgi:xylan 1,4-beta-xylosidase